MINSRDHGGNSTTLYLGKPPGGSLPVFKNHCFASNWLLAILESAEEKKKTRKNVLDMRVNLGKVCIRSGHAINLATTHRI